MGSRTTVSVRVRGNTESQDDYVRDITYPAGAVPVFAAIPADVDPLSPDVIPFLKDRVEFSGLEGVPIRCLILCNPHNPIPRCYPTEAIQAYIELAQAVGEGRRQLRAR